jgi:hypothetical protein
VPNKHCCGKCGGATYLVVVQHQHGDAVGAGVQPLLVRAIQEVHLQRMKCAFSTTPSFCKQCVEEKVFYNCTRTQRTERPARCGTGCCELQTRLLLEARRR